VHNGLGTESTPAPSTAPGDTLELAPAANGLADAVEALATTSDGPRLAPERGLYAVLGLEPSASDAEIQTTYRRLAAKLIANGSHDNQALRQLNVAYEVLGNPVRRAEYDRLRLAQLLPSVAPTPIRPGAKALAPTRRRTRPRHVVQPRYAGLPDVLVVLMVVGLSVLAGVLILRVVSVNLSALNVLQNVLPLSNSSRKIIDTSVTPARAPATPAPSPTTRAGLAERFAGSGVSVANPNPAQNSSESVIVRLRRDGQPATNFDVWATVQYRTTEERWPASGSQKTDASGSATITFNVGPATPNYPVTVRVFAQIDDQQLSWSTAFTPR
jgi:hypothetical protein